MPRTTTEKQISRSRRGGILVPLLEERLRHPVKIEDAEDAKFVHDLLIRQAVREEERATMRRYSPSNLASCMRAVYLLRHWRELGITPKRQTRIEPNFYFLTGDWLHLKWQFVLHRMHREGVNGFELIGCEIPVVSKRGDHGGTIDAIVRIDGELVVPDFKGLNVRAFQQATRGEVDLSYKIQLSDYIFLANNDKRLNLGEKITRGILVIENKGGPEAKTPIALTEVEVNADEFKPEIKWRLEALREHEKENSIPPPACESPYTLQFQGCPFRGHCRKEVKEVYAKAKRISESSNSAKLRVATPDRKRRTNAGRNSRRRGSGSA